LAAAYFLWYVAAGFEVATVGCWSGNAAVAGERERGAASRGGAGTCDRASPDASSRHSSEFVGRVCLQRHRRARGRRGGGGSAPCARTVPRSTAARCREAALGGGEQARAPTRACIGRDRGRGGKTAACGRAAKGDGAP